MNKQTWFWVILPLFLMACNTAPQRQASPYTSGYSGAQPYGTNNQAAIDNIPDAVPRYEPLNPTANNPYVQFNREYRPIQNAEGFTQRGIASWYGTGLEGNPTASGEPYFAYAMTAAHTTLPIPSYARVTSMESGRSVIVRINDRGPFIADRIIHLSYVAAYKLGMANNRTGEVMVESVTPNARPSQYRSGIQFYDNKPPAPNYGYSPRYSGPQIYDNPQSYNNPQNYNNSQPYNGPQIYDNSQPYNSAPYSPDAPLFTIQPNSR